MVPSRDGPSISACPTLHAAPLLRVVSDAWMHAPALPLAAQLACSLLRDCGAMSVECRAARGAGGPESHVIDAGVIAFVCWDAELSSVGAALRMRIMMESMDT